MRLLPPIALALLAGLFLLNVPRRDARPVEVSASGTPAADPAPQPGSAVPLRGSLALPDALARPEVAGRLHLEVRRSDAPAERLDDLPWPRMTAPDGVGARLRIFASRALPEGEYVLTLAPLGFRFPVTASAAAAPVDLAVPQPARTLVDAREADGAPLALEGARAVHLGEDGAPATALVLPLGPGEAEVLSAPGRLHVSLPGREWWPRGGELVAEPGWNHLELRPRRALTARVALVEAGAPRPMPYEWWERVAVEPLEGAGEVLGRGFGGVSIAGVDALLLFVSGAGDYRLKLPQDGSSPARTQVVHVTGVGARDQQIELGLDSMSR
jgi:hypothetical protein